MTQLEVSVRRRLSPSFELDASFVLDFDAAQPVAALFGPSGCGKSTTLALVAGLVAPDAGRIVLDGATLVDTASGTNVAIDKRSVGLVAQDGLLFPHLTVGGNLDYAERRARGHSHPSREDVVDALRLEALLARGVGSLSGGERQRVALGRALVAGPRLLCLDEPVSALDEAARWEILTFVERVTQRFHVPTLYVSHHRIEVARLATQVVRMDAGRVAATGRAVEVLADAAESGGVSNLIRATVTGGESGEARLADGTLLTLPVARPADEIVWCRVPSGAVTLERPGAASATSARNRMPGRVVALTREALRVRVVVDAAVSLQVDVTPQAAGELGLKPGAEVVCVFKTHSIEVLG